MRKYFTLLTDIGQSKVAEFVSDKKQTNIVTFVAGDGNGEYYIPTSDMTALKNEVWRGTISSTDIIKDAQNVIRVNTAIPAEVGSFIVRETGLLDDKGNLIAIGNTPDLPKVCLEDGASTDLKLSMRVGFKNAEAFYFQTDPNMVIMTKDMLDNHNVDENAHKELFDEMQQKIDTKANSATMTTELAKKANQADMTTELAKKANQADMTTELAKKAGNSHTHSASDISDTIPISKGGTGATSASTALSNLGGFPNTGGTINGNATITGNLTLKGSSAYGNKINFGDSDYVHISEPTDDNMEIKAKNVNFVVSGNITQNGNKIGGSMTKSEINSVITSGTESTSLGTDTFANNPTGYGNTAFGSRALYTCTTGEHNTAVGQRALCNNSTGYENTAIGERALMDNTTGFDNTAVGYQALESNTTGRNNVAIGYGALYNAKTGMDNVAIGKGALRNTTAGECLTAIGDSALSSIPSGSSYYNCAGIGYNAQVTNSNQVQLGDTSVTVYAQKALVTRSDARDKLDIEDSPLGLNFILKLRPRKYRMNSREAYFEPGEERDFSATNDGSKAGKRPHYGLVAQEVKEVMNELGVDFAGYLDSKVDGGEDVLSLGYTEFIAPIIKAIQQQQQIIEQLQKEIAVLKGE